MKYRACHVQRFFPNTSPVLDREFAMSLVTVLELQSVKIMKLLSPRPSVPVAGSTMYLATNIS